MLIYSLNNLKKDTYKENFKIKITKYQSGIFQKVVFPVNIAKPGKILKVNPKQKINLLKVVNPKNNL